MNWVVCKCYWIVGVSLYLPELALSSAASPALYSFLYLGGECGDLVAIRCQKQMLFGSGNRCESTFSQVSWARGVSLPDALQLNQFHSLSRYNHVGLDLNWPSNSKKYRSPGRGTCCYSAQSAEDCFLGPPWLTCGSTFFWLVIACPFCVLC